MRLLLPLLLLAAIVATTNAAPARISGLGFTLVAAKGWEDKTSGAELALRNGTDRQLRATLAPDFADRVATSAKSNADCLAVGTEFAKTVGADDAKPAKARAAKRSTCELTGSVAGTPMLAIMVPIGRTAAIVLCFGPKESSDWHADCRTMAGSIAIDPKATPAATSNPKVTTTKLPKGGKRINVAKLQFDLPAGWEPRATTSDQMFNAFKGDAILKFSIIPRPFISDTDANCSKLAATVAESQGAKGEGRIVKLNVGTACTVSLDAPKGAHVFAKVSGPGPNEHVQFSCGSVGKDMAILKECGYVVGTLAFDAK